MSGRQGIDAGASHIRDIIAQLCAIQVLVVLDGKPGSGHYASFGPGDPSAQDDYFGLSTFIDTLTQGGVFGQFNVTRAHRDTDVRNAADLSGFRFDQHDLQVYDCIFLFGVAPPGSASTALDDAELAAVTRFMDAGGGVFATGDHEDLGALMCGGVPRVRSMRKWYFPGPGPLGEPGAPPAVGTNRIDTTQPAHHEAEVQFDNQSDDIPQPISPKYYLWNTSVFTRRVYPHPVLCGPNGPITVLPDHMHEGEVIEPDDLGHVFSFGGQSFREYPNGADGQPVRPEIIATGKVLPETNHASEPSHTGDPNYVATARTFGVIGAYDGHRAGVGRVVVDSTWHHFFDINLIGDPAAPAGPKQHGFHASPQGEAALAEITAYYRNIATWIARPARQAAIGAGAALVAATSQPLAMIIRPGRHFTENEITHIGALAYDHILRYMPPCSILQVTIPHVPTPVPFPTPWHPPLPDPNPLIAIEDVSKVLLGHMAIAMGQARHQLQEEPRPELAGRLAKEATRAGLKMVASGFREQAARLTRLQQLMEGAVGQGRP